MGHLPRLITHSGITPLMSTSHQGHETRFGGFADDLDWEVAPGTGKPGHARHNKGGTARRAGRPSSEAVRLLDGDAGSGALERLLGLVGGLLVGLLQDGLRCAVDQVLGLLEAQAGELAHDLDDLDLLVAGGLEDDVELVRLRAGLVTATATAGGRGGRNGDGRRGGDAEGLLELLHEVGDLDQRLLLERLDDLVIGQGCHVFSLSQLADVASPATSVSGATSMASATAWAAAPSSLLVAGSPAASAAVVSGVSSTTASPEAAPGSEFSSLGSSALAAASAAGSSATAAAGAGSSTGAGAPGPPPRMLGSACAFASSAPRRRANCASGAASALTSFCAGALSPPASLASSTSRDSRSASLRTSSAVSGRPSRTPPLTTSSGWTFAKSRSPLATTTGSPVTKATAEGPWSNGSRVSTPASRAAILVNVFLTTA